MTKPVFKNSNRSDTNWAVQSQNLARSLKFQIQEVEGCSENKGADQLPSYRAADQYRAGDLGHCFCICKEQVFSSVFSQNS